MKKISALFCCLTLMFSFSCLAQTTEQKAQFTEQEYGAEAAVLNSVPTIPSYSCTGKLNNVETLVCDSTELAVADNLMVMAYKKQMEQTPDEQKPELKKAQLQWLKERNQCETAECVLQKTQARVKTFAVVDANSFSAAVEKIKLRNIQNEVKATTQLKTPIEYFNVVGYRMCLYGAGKLKCSVYNRFGNKETPVPETVSGLKKISLSGMTVCLLTDNGVNCYGFCEDTSVCNVPAEIKSGVGITDIAVGKEHACVIKNGQVVCWGSNQFGQLNIPTIIGTPKAIYAGVTNSCVVNAQGEGQCWGTEQYGVNNIPTLSSPIRKLDVSAAHACALLENGQITCWGIKEGNPLGGVIAGQSKAPSKNHDFSDLSVGRDYNCAVKNGGLQCWGDPKVVNTFPKDITGVLKVSAGAYHVCALRMDGVSCWGLYEDDMGRWVGAGTDSPITLDN